MLRYFRINDPYRLLGLLALLILLTLPLFIDSTPITKPELKSFIVGEKVAEGYSLYTEIIDSTPPLAAWFYGLSDLILGRSLTGRHVITFIILFLQSAFLGIILLDKKVFPENTYIPSLLFSILTLISFDMLALSADLLAFGFLLMALNAMLTEIEFRIQREETIFNLGLFLSIATLFNFSFIIYLPGIILILIIFTRNNLRKYLLLLTGFLLPHLIMCCLYFIQGDFADVWHRLYIPAFQFPHNTLLPFKALLIICSVPIFFFIISLLILNREGRLTNYQSQVLQAMFLWFVIALVQIYFTPDLRPQSLLPLAPAISFFFTHFFLLIRRRKFAETGFWILLIGILSSSHLARYNKISLIDYQPLLVNVQANTIQDKKLLMLAENDLEEYYLNKLSPPFISWPLTVRIFDNADVYENVLLVNKLMTQDPPDIIVDPKNRMEKFFYRLPELEKNYKKNDDGNWIKISN